MGELVANPSTSYGTLSTAIDAASPELRQINLQLYNNPELKFEEVKACALLCSYFENRPGWVVRKGVYGLDTAFEAKFTRGTGGRTICYNAEYDALPGIGHGCGHNLIAINALASAVAVSTVMQDEEISGTLIVMGTPGEETGGGKDIMARNGAWKDVDAAMMVHPMMNQSSAIMNTRASLKFRAEYYGAPAHAAASPWEGRNACDAIVQAYVGLGFLRQHIPPTQSIQAVILEAGVVPNVIPEFAKGSYSIRTRTSSDLAALKERVVAVFESAAQSTGCTVKMLWDATYDDVVSNHTMGQLYQDVMVEQFGAAEHPSLADAPAFTASSDFGNCTYICPGIQTIFAINATDGPHTMAFQRAAGSDFAHEEALRAAKGNAAVGIEILRSSAYFERCKREWQTEMKTRGRSL